MNARAIAEMLDRDRTEWYLLVALLDSQSDAPVHDLGSPDWNARDVYTHLARWLNHSTDDFAATLAGRSIPRPAGTDDEINERWQKEDAGLSLAEARRRAHLAFDRRLALLQATPPDRWTPALEAIAHADGYEHIEAHRRYIESTRG